MPLISGGHGEAGVSYDNHNCETCGHALQTHEEDLTSRISDSLFLRGRCLVGACSCNCYIGVLWERPDPEPSEPLVSHIVRRTK